MPDRCIPSAISFSETVLSVNCRGYANFWLHANLKRRTSRGGILWRWQASMSSENSAIRDLKKGTGSDRGHLTRMCSKALCQKVGFCYFFVIVGGTPASGLAVSTDMCGECAPNTAVSHKIAAAKHWEKHIPLRQDQVTLSSVIQSAEL